MLIEGDFVGIGEVIEDIFRAKQVISGSFMKDQELFSSKLNLFHQNSYIYRFSNENIVSYQKYLENRKKVLSVTASGDQILSSILFGAKEIDSFDISRFPRYYMELKKAAILSLNQQEFLNFFSPEDVLAYGDSIDLKELYYGFNQNLPWEYKLFWDEIINTYDLFDVYTSALFEFVCHDPFELVIPYLQVGNYDLLKSRLKDVEIRHYVGDVFHLSSTFDQDYDLIHLSNIIAYSEIETYQKLVEETPLKENGSVLSYLFFLYPQFKEIEPSLDQNHYHLEKVTGGIDPDESKSHILVYKK